MSTSQAEHHVVVLGAGYAGVLAANRTLASLTPAEADRVRLTVVNAAPDFVDRIRLHEVAAGTREHARTPLADVLHARAAVVVGTAEHVDAAAHVVRLATAEGEQDLRYDTLVWAVGSRARADVPGAREHAHLLADVAGAEAARDGLARLPRGARVVVVGGGLTGVEAVAEVAERRRDLAVTLLSAGEVAPSLGEGGRRRVLRRLRALGVEVLVGARVREVRAGGLVLDDGVVPFDACVWAASFAASDLAARSGLPVDALGRLRVEADLTVAGGLDVPGGADVVGAGDAVVLPHALGAHVRMSCAAALPLGAGAAATVLARLRGEVAPAVSVGYGGQCVSLGRRGGVLQTVRADDAPRRLVVGGRVAAVVKELICPYAAGSPRWERRLPGTYRPLPGPVPAPRAGAARAAEALR